MAKRGSSFLVSAKKAPLHKGFLHSAFMMGDVSSPCHPGSRSLYDPHRFSVSEDVQRYKNFVPSADGLTCPDFTLQPLPPSTEESFDAFTKATVACERAVGEGNCLPDSGQLRNPMGDAAAIKVTELLRRDPVNACLASLSTNKEMFSLAGCHFTRYAAIMLSAEALMKLDSDRPLPFIFFGAALMMPFARGVNVAGVGHKSVVDSLSHAIMFRHLSPRSEFFERSHGSVAMAHLGRTLALRELVSLPEHQISMPTMFFNDSGARSPSGPQTKNVDAVTVLERALDIGVPSKVVSVSNNEEDDALRGLRLRHSILVSAATLLEKRGEFLLKEQLTVDGTKRTALEVQEMAETLKRKLGDQF